MFAREIEKLVETADSGRKKRPKPADIQKIPLFLKENPPIPAQITPAQRKSPANRTPVLRTEPPVSVFILC